MPGDPGRTPSGGALAAGAGVLALLCCGGLPLLGALVGSVALGTLLGVGGAALAAVVVIALLTLRLRARPRACPAKRPSQP